ncbi:MAG TPA: PEGA domain-containing protein [Polyangia bacterium]|nr:PEGA domain-containing protein [Polyangia bacterium]
MDNEDYAAAAAEFELSVRIFPTKMGLFNLANCYKALNRYGDSLDTLVRLEAEFAGNLGGLAGEVATMKNTIEGMVGQLDVNVDRDGATIRVDGAEVGVSPLPKPLVLAPGDHVVEARYPGSADASQTVRIVSREKLEVSFVLEEQPPSGPAPVVALPEPEPPPVPLASAETPALSAKPEMDRTKRGVRGGAWACFIVGAGAGLASLAWYGLASHDAEEFADARDDYAATVDALETDGPTAEIAADGQRAWSEMESASTDAEQARKFGLGFGIGAGVLVAAATALFVMSRGRQERAEEQVTVTAAPGGFTVEF